MYSSIQIATRAAEQFTRLYYSTYDSATRVDDLPKFYRDSSSLTWNGKPHQGIAGVKDIIQNMPPTSHEVHSFDCHPIPGSDLPPHPDIVLTASLTGVQPPSLLVTVSGSVTHGRGPNQKSKNVDGQPRVFSQTFMLVPDSNAPPTKTGEVAKYFVNADAMRFVG
jgi:NTF2-related export protein 1/2